MTTARAWASVVASGIVAAAGLVGCIGTTDCYLRVGASIRAPILPISGGDFVGSCPRWMEIGGEDWTQLDYEFEFDDDDLEPIGQASRIGIVTTPVADMTIFAIDGLDPADVVAMEAHDGRALVFTRTMGWSGRELPAVLCPKLAETSERPPDCA